MLTETVTAEDHRQVTLLDVRAVVRKRDTKNVSIQSEKFTQDEIDLMRWADDGGYVPPDDD